MDGSPQSSKLAEVTAQLTDITRNIMALTAELDGAERRSAAVTGAIERAGQRVETIDGELGEISERAAALDAEIKQFALDTERGEYADGMRRTAALGDMLAHVMALSSELAGIRQRAFAARTAARRQRLGAPLARNVSPAERPAEPPAERPAERPVETLVKDLVETLDAEVCALKQKHADFNARIEKCEQWLAAADGAAAAAVAAAAPTATAAAPNATAAAPNVANAAVPSAKKQSAFRWADGEEGRKALAPILHPDIWAFRKKLQGLHWNAEEVDLTRDKQDWTTRMDADQRHFVKQQLGFFASVDLLVLAGLDAGLGFEEVDCMEASMYYAAQKDQECVHAEAYSLQIEAVMDGDEREAVLNAVRTMPTIARMHAWVQRWFDRSLSIGERLVAFAAVEGVLFSASFSALQWLRELNLLPGITDFNSFIVRDEGVHTLFTCLLVRRYLRERPAQERAAAIFDSVVEVIDDFVTESLPVRLIKMNDDLMKQYVRFQADCVLIEMGYDPVYRVENPFKFMDKVTLNEVTKVNFFEARGTQYQNVSRPGQARLAIDDTPVED
jgi:ribonucleoside-diphosphate reductase subunit M2